MQHPRLYDRQEVLHGISVEDGKKKNSLKAILLVRILTTIVHDIVEGYPRNTVVTAFKFLKTSLNFMVTSISNPYQVYV